MFQIIFCLSSIVVLFCVWCTDILIRGLSVYVSCFLMVHLNWSSISDTEYDSSVNLSFTFQVGPDVLNLLFLYDFF